MSEGASGGFQGSGGQGSVKDVDEGSFTREVLEASRERAVVVDFWAPWCAPCRTLGPILEQAVEETGGKVVLAKVNVDENTELARRFQVRSIPMVIGFKGGVPADGFMGALSRMQVRRFVSSLSGGGEEAAGGGSDATARGDAAFSSGDLSTAAQAYGEAIRADASDYDAATGLARCYARLGDLDRVRAVLDMAPQEERERHEGLKGIGVMLDLAGRAEGRDEKELRERVERDEKDWEARHDLAMLLAGRYMGEEATGLLLEVASGDGQWRDGAARKTLLEVFEVMGQDAEATKEGRRKLSGLLFR